MLTGQCVGLEEQLVFVCIVNGADITLPHRAGALQYRCRSHDCAWYNLHSEVSAVLMVHLSSSANPRSTDHITLVYALHVDDHSSAGSNLCLPSTFGEGKRKEFDQRRERCCVFSASPKAGSYNSCCFLSPFTTPTPSHIKGQLQHAFQFW
jgi:hypothetical protein